MSPLIKDLMVHGSGEFYNPALVSASIFVPEIFGEFLLYYPGSAACFAVLQPLSSLLCEDCCNSSLKFLTLQQTSLCLKLLRLEGDVYKCEHHVCLEFLGEVYQSIVCKNVAGGLAFIQIQVFVWKTCL